MRRALSLRCFSSSTSSRVPPPPVYRSGGPSSGSTSYGPFSAAAKARLAREQQQQQQQQQQEPCSHSSPMATASERGATGVASGNEAVDVMSNIGLGTNLHLRLSLAALPHPSHVRTLTYQSPEWRRAMTQLYRTILRLHNKTVAVSMDRSRRAGAADAVAAVTGVRSGGGGERVRSAEERFLKGSATSSRSNDGPGCCHPEDAEPKSPDDFMLKYLLTPEQRVFGNRFVQSEFMRNQEADAMSGAIFYESWYQYVLQLASGVTARDLTEDELRLLSPEQKEKLKEMRGAFTDLKARSEPGYML